MTKSAEMYNDLLDHLVKTLTVPVLSDTLLVEQKQRVTKYNSTTDGLIVLLLPVELERHILTTGHMFDKGRALVKQDIKDQVKELIKNGPHHSGTINLGKLEIKPSVAAQDVIILANAYSSLVWYVYRQLMVEDGLMESGHFHAGIRVAKDNRLLVVCLPIDYEETNQGINPATFMKETIDELQQELQDEDNHFGGFLQSTPDEKIDLEDSGHSLDEIKKKLGITDESIDTPPTDDPVV